MDDKSEDRRPNTLTWDEAHEGTRKRMRLI